MDLMSLLWWKRVRNRKQVNGEPKKCVSDWPHLIEQTLIRKCQTGNFSLWGKEMKYGVHRSHMALGHPVVLKVL